MISQPSGSDRSLASPSTSAASISSAHTPVASDILRGANEIAEFIYGRRSARRAVYHLVEKNRIPHFRIGTSICARKSVLLAWIAAQEATALEAT
ncbi:DNA-binding protein [Bradyrhizobium sp. CCGUVB14]|uniref:DNA-binding protein n=1 Tax=Bradyrhizobium sp. CCGUVB14 TaxID=2949628 RepID=UPI0020B1FB35|nr:DNA-binding protein [Bradyrhizobium sp. CCGUVB14]MCP3439809.1 DNA-binding protein [Bradyrhizobium sp. CCGUVB14]